jgi:hypothetical protein
MFRWFYSNHDTHKYAMEQIVIVVSIKVSVLVEDGDIRTKHVTVLPTLAVENEFTENDLHNIVTVRKPLS